MGGLGGDREAEIISRLCLDVSEWFCSVPYRRWWFQWVFTVYIWENCHFSGKQSFEYSVSPAKTDSLSSTVDWILNPESEYQICILACYCTDLSNDLFFWRFYNRWNYEICLYRLCVSTQNQCGSSAIMAGAGEVSITKLVETARKIFLILSKLWVSWMKSRLQHVGSHFFALIKLRILLTKLKKIQSHKS